MDYANIIGEGPENIRKTAKQSSPCRAGSVQPQAAPKRKRSKRKIVSFGATVLMLLCGVLVSAVSSQEGWKIKKSEKDSQTGTIRIIEEHPDGKQRTTTTVFYPGTDTPRNGQVETKDGDLRTVTSKSWNDQGEEISYSEEHFDLQGKMFEGKRWAYQIDGDGRIVGPKKEEEYQRETGKWATLKTEIGWFESPDSLKISNQIGKQFTFICSELPKEGSDYNFNIKMVGRGTYESDSIICPSAVSEGLIEYSGGKVTIEIRPKVPGSSGGRASFIFMK